MNVKPFWGVVVALGVSMGAGSAAAQQKHFEEAAQGAPRVDSQPELASLFWSQLSDCSKEASDLRRRQCQGVRAARAEAVSGTTMVIEGDARSFRVAGFDDKKNDLTLELTGCIACAEPVEVAGGRYFVVAERGTVEADGDGLKTSALYTTTRTFQNKAWADRWAAEIVPRLRSEYLVQVPAQAKTWTGGKQKALRVKVVGFRVYDPCDGKIICADPPSNPTSADKSACGENVMTGAADKEAEPKKDTAPAAPKLPATLTTYMINTALAPARKAAQQCYITYGVAGNASFRITISDKGQVTALQQKGDFVDTPTGACVEKAVKAVTFPETRKKSTTIDYPFMLR
jgi:hypothetical protein